MRKKAEQQRKKKNIRHERYEYFSGKADPDVYIENPFSKKILFLTDKDTMQNIYLMLTKNFYLQSMFEDRLCLRYNVSPTNTYIEIYSKTN